MYVDVNDEDNQTAVVKMANGFSSTTTTTTNGLQDDESITSPLLLLRRSASNTTSQIAIVGSNPCPIESLDYEIIENDVFKQDWRSQSKSQIFQYISMKWILCFVIGIVVSLIGFFNNLAIENIAGVKFVITSNMMFANRYWAAFFIFAAANLGLTLFAVLITTLIAPETTGSGIPEVKAYLNGVDAPAIFSFRTLLIKIVGTIAAVSSSLNVGKAGPMVHTGACIAALTCQGGSKKYGLTWKWFRFFNNDRDRRDLVTCGSAAGIAAAFRAPVGGVLFALEEMASWWRSALLWRAFFSTAVVAILLRGLTDICLSGKCGPFGTGGLIMFDVTEADITYHLIDVPPVLLLGVIGGIAGGLYNFLLGKILRLYNLINEKGTIYKVLLACTVSIITSCLLFGLPWFASYGRLVGLLIGSTSNLNHGLFAVLGAASLLGGSMRMTVSLCVILLELTNNLLLLPLIMLVLLVSKTVADAFNGNVYDQIMKFKGFPYLETHAEPYMRQLTVSDVVSGPLRVFNGIELVANIVHVLKTTGHNGFPVVDEPPYSDAPVLYGLILRSHLITLLKKKAFYVIPTVTDVDAVEKFSSNDFAKKGLGSAEKIEDIELTEEEMEMFVDLHPFTNASPYTVVETMSLAKALTLFRGVGLRHLLVVPKTSGRLSVVGILTRHDFMPEHILGLHPLLARSKWKRLRLKFPLWDKLFSSSSD
ncbi:putative CBS domain, chloride channel, voltage gated, chloride channel, core [Helianthus annuus]|nr:putative CBS domain, chloride channel, voltage gated, chloride channel, core [Helianthus annuus]